MKNTSMKYFAYWPVTERFMRPKIVRFRDVHNRKRRVFEVVLFRHCFIAYLNRPFGND